MREVLTCPICQSQKFQTVLTCKDFTVSGELFQIKECTECLLLATSPAPEIQDLPRYYQSDHYISHTSKATSLINQVYLQVRSYTLAWKERLIKQYIPSTKKSILDFGCGTGEFLQKCKSQGWLVDGVEPTASARSRAEINCQQTIAPSIEGVLHNNFEIITLWHVLEHIPDLNSTLQKLHDKLGPNGHLLIAIPNPSCWDSSHYKNIWAAYDVPRHLWHFRSQNLELLLRNCGFTLERRIPMKLDSYYVCMLSEKYKSNGNTTIAGIIKAIINATRSNLSARKNGEYSSTIYIAKK